MLAFINKMEPASWMAILLLCAPLAVCGQTETGAQVIADIPVGPADTNEATSRGLTAVLDKCAAAYVKVQTMHSVGEYHAISKSGDDDTTHAQSRISLDYSRPDRVAARSSSDAPRLDSSFIADGEFVTQISGDDKKYLRMPQPERLASFCDPHRPGEYFQDKSGALGIAVTAPMLMSDDPYAILHEDISRYVYEGEEKVGKFDCHRVRFVQEDPDVMVNLWIDKSTWFIVKASFITSYDKDFKLVESFQEGAVASMVITTWDEVTTDPEKVNPEAFRTDIPPGYTEFETARREPSATKQQGGFWESLVTIAAETSPEETTWSLTSDPGPVHMRIDKFAELEQTVRDFDEIRVPGTSEPMYAIAQEDGTVSLHHADGTVSETVKMSGPAAMFSVLETKTSGPLLLTVNKLYNKVTAHNLAGDAIWEYQHPYATIASIATVPPEDGIYDEAVYVTLAGKDGLRKLGADGKVQWSNSRVSYSGGMKPAPAGVNRILNRGVYSVGLLDKTLKQAGTFETDQDMPSMRWDTQEQEYPVIAVAVSSDSDILLQRRSEKGEVVWTTMIAPKAEKVQSSALHWVRARANESVQRCLAVLLSDGQIVLADTAGKIFYRGQISANEALIQRNNGSVVQNMGVADLDQDGVDEIYTRMDNYVLRLVTEE